MKLTVFQDFANLNCSTDVNNSSVADENDAASIFFELANADLIGYRVARSNSPSISRDSAMIVIKQHNDSRAHTGGIIWETSYLLAAFLSSKFGSNDNKSDVNHHPLGKTLEIGAGCGMLGLVLATTMLSSKVVTTEAEEVMGILTENVDQNTTNDEEKCIGDEKNGNMDVKGIHGTKHLPVCSKENISVHRLRWDCLQEDISSSTYSSKGQENDLNPHSFDTIVGTDVVFSPSLVCPLLETIKLMSHKKDAESKKSTRIYLCLQVRCADSHSMLFSEAHKYDLEVINITEELNSHCPWGKELECLLLQVNVKENTTITKHCKKQKKKSKEKKSSKTSSKVNRRKKKDKKSSKKRKRDEC